MHKKVVVLPLSMYVKVDQQKSREAFAALGVSKFNMLLNWFTLDKKFKRYRRGELTTNAFRNEIRKIFPDVCLSKKAFDAAWNLMCDITASSRERFEEVNVLRKMGIEIYFISSTNELHAEHIENLYGQKMPGNTYYSFEKGQLGVDLYDEFISEMQSQNVPAEDICIFYEPPKIKLGFFAWFYSPFEKWFNHDAHGFVTKLEQLASTNAFTLEPCELSKEGALTKALREIDWLPKANLVLDSKRTFTPTRKRENERYWLRQPPLVIDLTEDEPVVNRHNRV